MADAKATSKIDPLAVLPAAQDVMKQIAQREAEKASVALREIVGGIRPIKWLVEKGTIVIAADGGGIPTVGFLDWGRPTARAFRRANRKRCASTASPRDRWGGPKVDAARSAIRNKSLDREASLGHSARRRHDRRQGSRDNRIGLTNAKLTCHMPNQPAASASNRILEPGESF